MAENGADGVVETHGNGAIGVSASAWRGYGDAVARNRGEITTAGDAYRADRTGTDDDDWASAMGLAAVAENSDATAINEIGGEIETTGDVAWGMYARSRGYGSATAVNRGRVITRGGSADDLPGDVGRTLGARGISVYSRHGSARAGNDATGRIDTHGKRAFGLLAETTGDGSRTSATAEAVNRGHVHTRGWNADGVVAIAPSATADNPNHVRATNAAGATITTAGAGAGGLSAGVYVTGRAATSAHGVAIARNDGAIVTGDTETTPADSMDAVTSASNGVAAVFFSTGTAAITNGGDVTVINTGDVTVKRANAAGLYAETFGSGTDTFTVRDSRVTGAIDFGAGGDTLSAHGDTWLEGAVSNLETLTKRGSGNLVMRGNASFSSGASAEVENGGLVFTGQFNLGTTGTMRIHDAARLTAVLVDTAAPPQITAGGGITFDGDEELFVQVSPGIGAADESTYLDGFDDATSRGTNPIANGTPVVGRTGQVALRTARGPSTVVDVGHIPLEGAATCTAIGCPEIVGSTTWTTRWPGAGWAARSASSRTTSRPAPGRG